MTTLRFDDTTEKRLNALSRKTGRTISSLIQELVENHLDDLEDYYLANITLERVRTGIEKTFSEASVREELGLDD